jgi:hypothetical protein
MRYNYERTTGVPLNRLAPAVVAVGLLAACGGDEGPLTADEFREQAQSICRDFEESDRQPSAALATTAPVKFIEDTLAILEDRTEEMRALEPPPEVRASWDDYLAVLNEFASLLRELGNDLQGASEAEALELARDLDAAASEPDKRATAIEQDLGIDDCAD